MEGPAGAVRGSPRATRPGRSPRAGSGARRERRRRGRGSSGTGARRATRRVRRSRRVPEAGRRRLARSEEHTSELQSLTNLVCRLLLEKKKKKKYHTTITTQNHKSCSLDASIDNYSK